MTVDELALARAKRQQAATAFDPETHFAAVETSVRKFVELHRRNVERRGRLAELTDTVDTLADPGGRCVSVHMSALANLLAVAVDLLAGEGVR